MSRYPGLERGREDWERRASLVPEPLQVHGGTRSRSYLTPNNVAWPGDEDVRDTKREKCGGGNGRAQVGTVDLPIAREMEFRGETLTGDYHRQGVFEQSLNLSTYCHKVNCRCKSVPHSRPPRKLDPTSQILKGVKEENLAQRSSPHLLPKRHREPVHSTHKPAQQKSRTQEQVSSRPRPPLPKKDPSADEADSSSDPASPKRSNPKTKQKAWYKKWGNSLGRAGGRITTPIKSLANLTKHDSPIDARTAENYQFMKTFSKRSSFQIPFEADSLLESFNGTIEKYNTVPEKPVRRARRPGYRPSTRSLYNVDKQDESKSGGWGVDAGTMTSPVPWEGQGR